MATAEQRRDFVPSVRPAAVRASGSTMSVSWPDTTEAFAQANIFARASGYTPNVMSTSAARSEPGMCSWRSPRLNSITRSRRRRHARPDAGVVSASQGPTRPRPGDLGPREPAGAERLRHRATGRHRPSDAATGPPPFPSRERNRHTDRTTARARSAEGVPERHGALRRRDHPTRCRCRRAGAGRRSKRRVPVHPDAERRAPHRALRPAGPSLRRRARGRSDHPRAGMPGRNFPER